ncbi:MAG TPA: TetR/AcrR family transcriptional regulator [Acidimicrobiia bacterium]|jgi:AcrR family transcriptional regulator
MTAVNTTKAGVLAAAKAALIETGYAQLSTRGIAEMAEVPLSQIHYHFGSKKNLVLAVLEEENRRLLDRQAEMYGTDTPLWKQWEQACDFLDEDLDSGYVRVLQEMMAAGWSDPEIADAVRSYLGGWFDLLRSVANSAMGRLGDVGMLKPADVASLAGAAFLGAEAMILLGFEDQPTRKALRSVGAVIRRMEVDQK